MTTETQPVVLSVSVILSAAMTRTLLRLWRSSLLGFESIGSNSLLAFWKVTAMSVILDMLALRARPVRRAE